MKVRVVYMPNGKVSIIHPAPKSKRPDETEEQWLERVFNKAMQSELKGMPYDDINKSELPQSREDRDAWRESKGKGIHIDQAEAQKLRQEKENNEKIANKIGQMAIDKLIEEGELPPDYRMALRRIK